ncbi:hypothetical protein [Maribrevibacterium harenarium]|uniref:hypothetical protein n=1 Tax=Maribrevibacterium harenarium TaxID=2589817 RepID=UPI0015E27F33|nr:hypothetical protein [Maribrevibacterium harenarium]
MASYLHYPNLNQQQPEIQVDKVNQVKQLVNSINQLHLDFSRDYFESGQLDQVNLSRTISRVPVEHIYRYRLTLHECINDYLMSAEIDLKYFYRVKTRDAYSGDCDRSFRSIPIS